jgi:hypothetical protein
LSNVDRLFFFIGLAWLLCSCAASQGPAFTYNEVAILNQSRVQVRDVTISATGSGRVFSCGNIAPRGICSDRFPPQPYQGKPIQIAWVIGNGARRSKIVELSLPEDAVPEIPLRGIVVISARGEITAFLQQDAPGPHM